MLYNRGNQERDKMTTTELLKELMEKYDEYRSKWIEMFGNDTGYNEWFTKQITKQIN
jgi:hypothetical protein